MIPHDDRGLTLGDGLFETMLVRDGEIVLFEPHYFRMLYGCEAMGLSRLDFAEVRAICEQAAAGMEGRNALRLTLTAGSGGRGLDRPASAAPRLFATIAPSPRPEGPIALATVSVRRNEGSPTSRLKTLAYLDQVLARREAPEGAEALMLNNRGELACAAAANLFWMADGELFTPARDCGVLDGIMAGLVRAAAATVRLSVKAVAAPRSALDGAQAIFITNSLIGLRPVASLDGVALSEPPPKVLAMAEFLAEFS